jgi:hypothetical protein
MYDDECNGCGNKDLVIETQAEEARDEALRKKERRDLVGPKRGPPRKK